MQFQTNPLIKQDFSDRYTYHKQLLSKQNHQDSYTAFIPLPWTYQADLPPWQDKRSMLGERVQQIEREIEAREKLKDGLVTRMLYQETRVDTQLFELAQRTHDAVDTNKVLVTQKLTLEKMLQDLQQAKWREYAACFRDIGSLKKELRDTLQEYWNEKRKEAFLGDTH